MISNIDLEPRMVHLHPNNYIKQDKKLLQECASDSERIRLIAQDISSHFEKNRPDHAVLYVHNNAASAMYEQHLKNHTEIEIVCSSHPKYSFHTAYADTVLDLASEPDMKIVDYMGQRQHYFL